MASLRTDYQDDVFSGERKYRMVNNSDGTVSFIDVTDYTQEGSTFGALDVNATNEAANQLAEDLGDISDASSVTGADAFLKIATLKEDLGNKATAADVAGANAFAKIHQLNTQLKETLITLNNTSSAITREESYARCRAGVCTISLQLSANTGLAGGGSYDVQIVGSSARPTRNCYGMLVANNGVIGHCTLDKTTGNLSIQPIGTIPANTSFYVIINYVLA